MDILLIFLLILVNGLFAMSEIAIVSARRSRLVQLADEGDLGARAALAISEHPTRFLSTVQIGITMIGVLSGAFGEAAITQRLIPVFEGVGLLAPYAKPLATACMVISITYVSIVVGELVPKRLGMLAPERTARHVAPMMRALAWLTMPVVGLLSRSTDFLLALVGLRHARPGEVTSDDIKALVAEGADAGVLEPAEQQMIENVMQLDDWQLGQIMTTRADIQAIDLRAPVAAQRQALLQGAHSYLPVYNGSLDDLVGMVAIHDVLARELRGEPFDLPAVMKAPVSVPAAISPLTLLRIFRERRQHVAVVVDEYGGVLGLVSVSDVTAALVGEFTGDLTDARDPDVVRREDGSFLLDGALPMQRLPTLFPQLSADDVAGGRDYQTLAGLVLYELGHLPVTGETLVWKGLLIEVVDMDRQRIDKLLVRRLPEAGA